eukprot:CAMPEP_0113546182 /NCGR_PEP_ID=MMETSP0015_2-20120614/11665_1 /TAXON_ID=2838 /ORGANISM="Odontella" /LENGTH=459 /DNA_ID=CAMNT_0000446611 /DNA_START=146 /DNA_END=1522 /DNA_ORIENTATION=+ /assembly_acc=CAM_ASM_000160
MTVPKVPSVIAIAAVFAALLLRAMPPTSGPVGMCPDSLPRTNPHSDGASSSSSMSSSSSSSAVVVVETERLGTVRAEPCRTFSESYREARDRFLSAADEAGADVTSIEVTRRGGRAYYMDAAVIRVNGGGGGGGGGGGPKGGLIIHTSGVHGVEGYAGSAVQVAALQHLSALGESSRRLLEEALGSTTLVFVHAVNPFGMDAFRRFNEENVDLNRNALNDEGLAEALARDPNVAGYDDFDESFFNPRRAPTAMDATMTVWIKAIYAIARNGYVNMKRSIVAAQYHNAAGIFYGGRELQASHRLLRDFLSRGGFFDAEGTVTWIDVHTGLGPRGLDTLMAHSAEEDPAEHFRDTPLPILHGLNKNKKDKKNIDAGSGYDLSRGVMEDLYYDLFSSSGGAAQTSGRRKPMILTQEFGTVNGVMVARAFILENMAYHYAAPEEHARWADYTRDAFYVRSDDW